MKNRLQFNYYTPSSWPFTREQAVNFIETLFSKVDGATPSLPSEPVVVYYGEEKDACNVILAIGRDGDGTNLLKNKPYFLIDSKKIEESVDGVSNSLVETNNDVETIYTMIADIKDKDNITSVQISTINEKLVSLFTKDETIENILNKDIENLSKEIERAVSKETELLDAINSNSEAIQSEYNRAFSYEQTLLGEINGVNGRIETIENSLSSRISDEINNRTTSDSDLLSKINQNAQDSNADRAAIRSELETRMQTEQNERNNADSVLDGKIFQEKQDRLALENRLASEEQRATSVEATLNSLLVKEIGDRTLEDSNVLSTAKAYTDELSKVVGSVETSLSKKVEEVISEDKSILITTTDAQRNLKVNIDGTTLKRNEDGKLSVDSSKLVQYTGVNAIKVNPEENGTKTIELVINNEDKILDYNASGLYADLRLSREGNSVKLYGKNEFVISDIDVTDFLKDDILENISYDPNTKYLVFEFNGGKQEIYIGDLIDYYYAGLGLQLDGSTFNIKINGSVNEAYGDTNYLNIDSNGLSVSGINKAIGDAKNELYNAISGNTNSINLLSDSILETRTSIETRLGTVKSELQQEFANDIQGFTDAYTTADTVLENKIISRYDSRVISLEKSLQDNETGTGVISQLSNLTTMLNAEVSNRIDADNSVKESCNGYTDTKISNVNGEISKITSDVAVLQDAVEDNVSEINVLKGGVGTEGSIKNIINGSVLGLPVTGLTADEARSQSLLKTLFISDTPYFYVSNNAADIVFTRNNETGEVLSLVNAMNNIIADNNRMREEIASFQQEINNIKSETFKNSIVDAIKATLSKDLLVGKIIGTENEIEITPNYNSETGEFETLRIGFADGTVFQAGI